MRLLAAILLLTTSHGRADEPTIESALSRAGSNRAELQAALRKVPAEQKRAMEFLVRYMPERDLKSLSAAFLLENVRLAYEARDKTPWGRSIPEEVFLNEVLPYAHINEERHPWRKDFMDRWMPVVKGCTTASEAAQKLNATVFGTLKVRYSTKRKKADQSPKESMASGLASCTGLSIVLADACRSVGVPARLVGIPQWANKRGNHTWVEIWDKDWHFTGAAEPSGKGLNHTWFQGDAAQAKVDSRMSAIYAASFRPTGTSFPLVWAPGTDWVNAVNVTNRYTSDTQRMAGPRLMVRVWNHDRRRRVAAEVSVTMVGTDKRLTGTSRDEGFDTNDILAFGVRSDATYVVVVKRGASSVSHEVRLGDRRQAVVDIVLPAVTAK